MNEWNRNGKILQLFCPIWENNWQVVNRPDVGQSRSVRSIKYSPINGEMFLVPSFLITYWNNRQKRITPKEYEVIYETTEIKN